MEDSIGLTSFFKESVYSTGNFTLQSQFCEGIMSSLFVNSQTAIIKQYKSIVDTMERNINVKILLLISMLYTTNANKQDIFFFKIKKKWWVMENF